MKSKMVDLFSGAGGLSCGLHMASFETIYACEIEPVCVDTYKYNNPDAFVSQKDIRKLTGKEILDATGIRKGELDLLVGGPPCQGFSINAPIRSLDDERNRLVMDFIRIAGELLPKFIIIENVTGIVSFGNGVVVDGIYDRLQKLGYDVDHKILFAGHYGVPQIRFRTIFFASRLGKIPKFPEPTHNAKARINFTGGKQLCMDISDFEATLLKPYATVDDALSDLPAIIPGKINTGVPYAARAASELQRELRNRKRKVYNHFSGKLGEINLKRLKHIPQGGSWRDIPENLLPKGLKRARKSDHTKRYGRLHPDGLCSTILTKCDPHWGSFFHPHEERVISVREAARIQTFPDGFRFLGSLTQQYAQVGNAVPPLMARAIGRKVMEVME